MPRPKKWRKVCCMPPSALFAPVGGVQGEPVRMTVDEYEAVRLIDHEGFSQEDCAGYMRVARTTAQQIYNQARHKLSLALVEGRPLYIQGGEYRLCDGSEPECGCGGCRRHRCGRARPDDSAGAPGPGGTNA